MPIAGCVFRKNGTVAPLNRGLEWSAPLDRDK